MASALKKIFFKLFHRDEFNRLFYDQFIFNAYTMGKVGSVTIEKSISARVFYNKVYHLHFLSEEGLKKHKEFNGTDQGYRDAEEFEAERKKHPEKKVKLITLVRDPLSRDMSDLFQNYRSYLPEKKINEIKVEELLERFRDFDHEYALQWFDEELKKYCGIDIFSSEFDKKKGFNIISGEKYDVLVIRLEDLASVYEEAMSSFTGVNGWKLLPEENTAQNKTYADLYNSFKKQVVIRKEVLDEIYNSKYYDHFYTEEEKSASRAKWERPLDQEKG